MKNNCCCGFGHREAFGIDIKQLSAVLEKVITDEGVCVFLTGDMGEFDKIFIDTVCSLKKKYTHISLILVKPRHSLSPKKDDALYRSVFDEVIIPEESARAHYKASIKLRNKWMVDQSNVVVAYVHREFGGAYEAVRYAKQTNKIIYNLGDSTII